MKGTPVIRRWVRKVEGLMPLGRRRSEDIMLHLGDVRLIVRSSDPGGLQYENNKSYEEIASALYSEVESRFSPSLVIDVGANYGFTGIVFARSFPTAKIVLLEPSSELVKYVKQNLEINGYFGYETIHAVCAEESMQASQFFLNPSSSQDNRVIPEDSTWRKEIVRQVCLDDVLEHYSPQRFVFVKIDTQGYEERVVNGFMRYLLSHDNWLIKVEFAPYWLRSQLTNPEALLNDWASKFTVSELPSRFRFQGDSLDALFQNRLDPSMSKDFVAFLEHQNIHQRGWCDLLLSPNKN